MSCLVNARPHRKNLIGPLDQLVLKEEYSLSDGLSTSVAVSGSASGTLTRNTLDFAYDETGERVVKAASTA